MIKKTRLTHVTQLHITHYTSHIVTEQMCVRGLIAGLLTEGVCACSLLGLETHVCEVQLVLRSFYLEPLSVDHTIYHKEYIKLRDLRAERVAWQPARLVDKMNRLGKWLRRALGGAGNQRAGSGDVESRSKGSEVSEVRRPSPDIPVAALIPCNP